MIIANFEGNESVKYVSGLYQYDKERALQITGLNLPRVVEIDFSLEETGVTSKSCPAITKDGITEVMIPNEMLVNQDTDMNYNIYAFVYVTDASTSETVKRIVMQVRARTKPEQFEALGNRELFEKAINEVNNSADRAETAANVSEQNAKKTAEDRKTIEEMVETVSGIEQQVQDVKKYAGQAETAASNAALSEQKAKESETAALQAKADAETAKGSAETAAGKTAEDRTAVESAKEEVLQAKQQVSADRAVVEAVQRKVAQMGNAIPQAVLEGVQAVGSAGAAEKQGIVQAGTEQKSAVESAGTKAVEDITLAKKTATDAVETAKTDAVGAVETAGTEQTQNVTAEGEKQVQAVQAAAQEIAADRKQIGQNKEDVARLKEDLNKLIEYKQEEQEYRMDDLVTGNWDSIGSGGYYDENGKYVANPSYRHGRINMRRTRYKLFVTTQNPIVLFIHVFNGEPSEQTFVKRYTAADFPTESNPLIVEPNQIVIVQNTPNVVVRLKANNKVYYEYGQIIKNITDIAEQAKDTATLANEKADKANATADSLEPSVERTKVLGITKSMMQFIGNKYPSATGSLYDHSGYWGYTYVIPEDGDFYIRNLGDSSFGFLAIYDESVADGNLAMNIESGATFATRYLTKGQIVLVSYALNTTDESKVRGGNITHTYKYTERPTMFIREMNVAWFGDSISQLQLLPHRVAEYMGITVNDVSFAGAPLTYSTTAYQGTGFMSLSSQIANGDFTELEKALSNQGTVSEDKRGNANRLKALDFSTITDIVVMAGTNDVNNDYVATSTDLTKFKNGMKLAIDTIITVYPQINLYFISNPYRGDITVDKHGNTLADFVQAEKEVCDEYNIPYYDLYHNSGINAKNISYYLMEDMLHQNEKGDILMAKKIAKWLISN